MNLEELRARKGFICDMDGVIYLGNQLLPGVAEFVTWLNENDKRFLFLTNSSERSPKELRQKLQRMGLDIGEEHFYTSALATAAFLKKQAPGCTAFVIGAPGAIDLVCDRLTVLGFDSFIVDDQDQFHEFLEENRQYWDYVDEGLEQQMQGLSQIRLYLEEGPAVPETISHLKDQLAALRAQYPATDFGSLDVQLSNVKDEDWENNWKQYYQPLPIGEKLLVVPEWLHPENPEHRVEVLLDPGMIFGTGAHASTQMCMRELERAIQGGECVLDLGSGSGILSITAILLGAAHATGVDIDPKAEDIARENAAINQIFADRFTAVTGDIIGDKAMMESLKGHYDVVLANIVADVIIPLSRVVPEFLQEDSIFICSGILNTRLPEVLDALEKNGLQILSTEQQEDWCRVTAALLET